MVAEIQTMPDLRNQQKLLITGGNGFIGRELVVKAVERGWQVRTSTRGGPSVGIAHENVRVDGLGRATDWSEALDGCRAVVHLAAHVHQMKRDAQTACHLINYEGTMRLASMAVAAGVRRFVFVSTVKVLGEASPGRAFNDADLAAPQGPYALSKYETEQGLMALADRSGLEVVVLRPPLVYGPGVKANFLAMMRRIAQGYPMPLGRVQSRRSFCFLGNLNDAILTTLEHPSAPGRRFLVSDGETLPLQAFVALLGHALGRPARLAPVPVGWFRASGVMLGRREQVRRLTESLEVDISGIRNALGWRPPWTIREGLAETARWYWQSHAQ